MTDLKHKPSTDHSDVKCFRFSNDPSVKIKSVFMSVQRDLRIMKLVLRPPVSRSLLFEYMVDSTQSRHNYSSDTSQKGHSVPISPGPQVSCAFSLATFKASADISAPSAVPRMSFFLHIFRMTDQQYSRNRYTYPAPVIIRSYHLECFFHQNLRILSRNQHMLINTEIHIP